MHFPASLHEACWQFSIHSWYYHQWKKKLDHVPDGASFNMWKIYSGHPGLFESLDDLLRNVFELYEQGMLVTTWIVLRRVSDLCWIFVSNQMVQSCLLCIGGWRHRDWGTGCANESQCYPPQVAYAFDFIREIRTKVRQIVKRYIINMDWILFSSSLTPNKHCRWEW